MVKSEIPSFQSTAELARMVASGQRYLVGTSNSVRFESLIQFSNDSEFKLLRSAIRNNPVVRLSDESSGAIIQYLSSHPNAVMMELPEFRARLLVASSCTLAYVMDQAAFQQGGGFVFRKGSPLVKKLTEPIIMESFRVREKFDKMLMKNERESLAKCQISGPGSPLSLDHFLLMIFVLLTGFGAGGMAILMEVSREVSEEIWRRCSNASVC